MTNLDPLDKASIQRTYRENKSKIDESFKLKLNLFEWFKILNKDSFKSLSGLVFLLIGSFNFSLNSP